MPALRRFVIKFVIVVNIDYDQETTKNGYLATSYGEFSVNIPCESFIIITESYILIVRKSLKIWLTDNVCHLLTMMNAYG